MLLSSGDHRRHSMKTSHDILVTSFFPSLFLSYSLPLSISLYLTGDTARRSGSGAVARKEIWNAWRNRQDGISFPFPRKVVGPWRGMRARNHHEWCWARTGASGAALASPRLGPKRNRHPRASPRRVHHPDRPRGGNSGGDIHRITLHTLLFPHILHFAGFVERNPLYRYQLWNVEGERLYDCGGTLTRMQR